MVSKKKDFVGNVLAQRPELTRADGLRLMGFRPVDRAESLPAGAHFLSRGAEAVMANDEGWMTSVVYSPTLGHSIGLGFIRRGAERTGEVVRAADPLRGREVEVEIVAPHFVDPDGERLRG
jgi:sarcosine oxidase subunit alpha